MDTDKPDARKPNDVHYNRKPITLAEFDLWATTRPRRNSSPSLSDHANPTTSDNTAHADAFSDDNIRRRRKLNWRVLPFQKGPTRPVSSSKLKLRDDISETNTVSGRSLKSNHTFHSMQTEVAGNKRLNTVTRKKVEKKTNSDAYLHMKQSLHNGKLISPGRETSKARSNDPHANEQGHTGKGQSDQLYALQSQEDIEGDRTITMTKPHRNTNTPPSSPWRNSTITSKNQHINDGRPPLARNLQHPTSKSFEDDKPTKEPFNDDSLTREQLEQLQNLSEGPRAKTNFAHHTQSEAAGDDCSIISDGSLQTQQIHIELNLRAMQELASRHIQNLEFEDAVEVWEEILRGQVQIYGYWHPRVGTVLHNLSLVHSLNKAYDHSAFICSKAIDVRLSTLGEMHLDLAESFAHLGLMRVELHEYDLAIQAFESALEIRRHSLESHDPKISRLLNNIGCAYYEIAQFEKAMAVFKEALEIQRFLMKTSAPALLEENGFNSVGRVLLSIAATLSNVASIYLKWNDYDQSIAAVEEALLLQESVLNDDDERVLDCRDLLTFVENERSNQAVKSRNLFVRLPFPFSKPSCC